MLSASWMMEVIYRLLPAECSSANSMVQPVYQSHPMPLSVSRRLLTPMASSVLVIGKSSQTDVVGRSGTQMDEPQATTLDVYPCYPRFLDPFFGSWTLSWHAHISVPQPISGRFPLQESSRVGHLVSSPSRLLSILASPSMFWRQRASALIPFSSFIAALVF